LAVPFDLPTKIDRDYKELDSSREFFVNTRWNLRFPLWPLPFCLLKETSKKNKETVSSLKKNNFKLDFKLLCSMGS
jgi:hypothetical protein